MPRENVTEARLDLASDAAGEIMNIAAMLQRENGKNGFDSVLRGALLRINDLASVALSVTGGDDGRPDAEMHQVIYGMDVPCPSSTSA